MTDHTDCETSEGAAGYRPAAMEIRPKSFGENLNDWFRAMGNTWKPLLVLCAIVYIPLGVLTVALFLVPGAHEAYFDILVPESEVVDPGVLIELAGPLIWVGAIWALLQILATVLVYVAVGRAVAVAANGGTATASDLLRFALSRLGSGVWAGLILLVGVGVLVAVVTLIGWGLISALGVDFFPIFLTSVIALTALVVILWLTVGCSLYPQAIAMEDVGATESLGSSFRLIRGRWWPTFGFVMVAGLIVSAVSQVISIALVPVLFLGFVAPVFLAIGYGLVTMLQGPLAAAIAVAYAVWYVDLRAREAPLTSEELV